MSTLSISSYTTSSITVHISGLSQPEGNYSGWRYNISGGPWQSGSGSTYTFSGLSSGADCSFSAQVKSANVWYDAGSCYGHTSVIAPSITFDTKTSTWLQVITHNNDSGIIETFINGVSVSSSGYPHQRTGDYLLISGLSPSTQYSLHCVTTKNGYSASSPTIYITTDNGRPANYVWSSAKISGNNFSLLASEWNGFTAKINEFRHYKGLSGYSFSTAYSGNIFAAVMFNEARYALQGLSPYFASGKTIPGTHSAGDGIYASYLNDMVNALNSIS